MASDAIDLEDLVPFPDAPSIVPGRPNISTLHRWRTKGVRGVRLVTVRIGGRRFVSRKSLEQFSARLTEVVDGKNTPSMPQTVRRRAVDAAEREVDARMTQAKPNAARG